MRHESRCLEGPQFGCIVAGHSLYVVNGGGPPGQGDLLDLEHFPGVLVDNLTSSAHYSWRSALTPQNLLIDSSGFVRIALPGVLASGDIRRIGLELSSPKTVAFGQFHPVGSLILKIPPSKVSRRRDEGFVNPRIRLGYRRKTITVFLDAGLEIRHSSRTPSRVR